MAALTDEMLATSVSPPQAAGTPPNFKRSHRNSLLAALAGQLGSGHSLKPDHAFSPSASPPSASPTTSPPINPRSLPPAAIAAAPAGAAAAGAGIARVDPGLTISIAAVEHPAIASDPSSTDTTASAASALSAASSTALGGSSAAAADPTFLVIPGSERVEELALTPIGGIRIETLDKLDVPVPLPLPRPEDINLNITSSTGSTGAPRRRLRERERSSGNEAGAGALLSSEPTSAELKGGRRAQDFSSNAVNSLQRLRDRDDRVAQSPATSGRISPLRTPLSRLSGGQTPMTPTTRLRTLRPPPPQSPASPYLVTQPKQRVAQKVGLVPMGATSSSGPPDASGDRLAALLQGSNSRHSSVQPLPLEGPQASAVGFLPSLLESPRVERVDPRASNRHVIAPLHLGPASSQTQTQSQEEKVAESDDLRGAGASSGSGARSPTSWELKELESGAAVMLPAAARARGSSLSRQSLPASPSAAASVFASVSSASTSPTNAQLKSGASA